MVIRFHLICLLGFIMGIRFQSKITCSECPGKSDGTPESC